MADDRARLTFANYILLGVVAVLVASTAIFCWLVAYSLVVGGVTPAVATSGYPFAGLLMGTAIGLLQLTRPFDEAHPNFFLDRAMSALTVVKRAIARLTGR